MSGTYARRLDGSTNIARTSDQRCATSTDPRPTGHRTEPAVPIGDNAGVSVETKKALLLEKIHPDAAEVLGERGFEVEQIGSSLSEDA